MGCIWACRPVASGPSMYSQGFPHLSNAHYHNTGPHPSFGNRRKFSGDNKASDYLLYSQSLIDVMKAFLGAILSQRAFPCQWVSWYYSYCNCYSIIAIRKIFSRQENILRQSTKYFSNMRKILFWKTISKIFLDNRENLKNMQRLSCKISCDCCQWNIFTFIKICFANQQNISEKSEKYAVIILENISLWHSLHHPVIAVSEIF